ncbi:MAG: SRPBCC domain-containing protein [Bdellovibrionales bacterium]|nr:SRPBCC domain-containing protein [Bdellovibrionales bacterium]
MAAKDKPNSLHLIRIYDAPVKMVWDAWADPEQAAQWWGPRGFTIKTHAKDLRAGGFWKYTMFGPDGTTWENKTVYHEVEKHSRLVYDHGGGEDRPPLFQVTVTFEEVKGGKTKMEMTMTMPSPEALEQTKKIIKSANGNSTWDRLAEYLGDRNGEKDLFVINRSFEAPIAKVFEMWSKAEHLAKWLPPTGFSMNVVRGELRPGSEIFYNMTDGKTTMWGKVKYLEISPVHLMRYTQEFSDEHGNMSRHPHAPLWPETMLTNVRFESEGENLTRVTVRWEPYGKATEAERAMFREARGGMTAGWTGSFDKLEAVLAK